VSRPFRSFPLSRLIFWVGGIFFRTSGLGTGSSSQRRKTAAYDPQRKWGLAPADDSATPSSTVEGATYVVAGHIVAAGKRDLFVNETVGREAQARAARKAGSRDVDKTLKRLLSRDKEGMKAVQEARAFAKKMKGQQSTATKPSGKEGVSGAKRKQKDDTDSEAESGTQSEDESDGSLTTDKPTRNAYSAQVIKQLGFDPTRRSGKGQTVDDDPSSISSKVCFFFPTVSCIRFNAFISLSWLSLHLAVNPIKLDWALGQADECSQSFLHQKKMSWSI
jgi:hypothetical protein